MRKNHFGFFILMVIIASSCEKKEKQNNAYFDSLVVANIDYLTKNNASIIKYSRIAGKEDTASFKPDSLAWTSELDVFRQLDAFQKPAFRDAYQVEDGAKDSQSNLTVRQFKASRPVAIPSIRFYYYQHFDQLKKIEAHYHEANTLYSATRHLIMEFDERDGKAVLSNYSLDGIQRMILSDSINYSIQSGISFQTRD